MKVNLSFKKVVGSLFMLPLLVWSQNCPNLNFGYGNLNFWQCYSGSCYNGNYSVNQTSPIPGRIDIMNANGLHMSGNFYDENCNIIKKVPDGYLFSCRIGNDNGGSEVDAMEYTLRVDSMNSLLMVHYAYVLQRCGSNPNLQPQFSIQIRDSAGNPLNIPCGNTIFTIGSFSSSLVCSGSIEAKDWSMEAFRLDAFIGKTVKVYLETRDCRSGGHFGYAYVVAECRPMQVEMAYCSGTTVARLATPEGFAGYEWTRSSDNIWREYTPKIKVQTFDGEVFTVNLSSELGCTTQLQTTMVQTQIDANFMFGVKGYYPNDPPNHVNFTQHGNQSWYDTIQRTVTLVDLSSVTNGVKKSILWEIKGVGLTGAQSRDSLFTYTFPDPNTPTTYLVRLTVVAGNGCVDTSNPIDHYITIYPLPKVKIVGRDELCEGDTIWLKPKAVYSKFTKHIWSWKLSNGTTTSLVGDSLLISNTGLYYLQSLDTNGWYAYDSILVKLRKPYINNLKITNLKCYGDEAIGEFQHGHIGGVLGGFLVAKWTIWDDAIKDYKDTNILSLLNGWNTLIKFTNQKAGSYYFYGKDTTGCELRDTITVLEPAPFSFSALPIEAICFDSNGQIAFQLTGGTKPYNISIEDTNTHRIIKRTTNNANEAVNLTLGVYRVTVKEANNCSVRDTVIVVSAQIIPLVSMSLQKEINIPYLNQMVFLTPTFTPTNACKDIVWHSNNDNIVTVNSLGRLKAVSYGETYVVMSSATWHLRDSCKVSVGSLGVTSITEEGKNIRIYPNPTTGILTIYSEELIMNNIEIYDIYGRKVETRHATSLQDNSIRIDISHLANGMYYLRISNTTVKIIKQ